MPFYFIFIPVSSQEKKTTRTNQPFFLTLLLYFDGVRILLVTKKYQASYVLSQESRVSDSHYQVLSLSLPFLLTLMHALFQAPARHTNKEEFHYDNAFTRHQSIKRR